MKDQNRYKNVSIVSETTETIHRSQPVQNKKSPCSPSPVQTSLRNCGPANGSVPSKPPTPGSNLRLVA